MKDKTAFGRRVGNLFSDFLHGRWRTAFSDLSRKNRLSVLQENVERAVAEYYYLAVPTEALMGAGYLSLDVTLKSGWRIRRLCDYETEETNEGGQYVLESN